MVCLNSKQGKEDILKKHNKDTTGVVILSTTTKLHLCTVGYNCPSIWCCNPSLESCSDFTQTAQHLSQCSPYKATSHLIYRSDSAVFSLSSKSFLPSFPFPSLRIFFLNRWADLFGISKGADGIIIKVHQILPFSAKTFFSGKNLFSLIILQIALTKVYKTAFNHISSKLVFRSHLHHIKPPPAC